MATFLYRAENRADQPDDASDTEVAVSLPPMIFDSISAGAWHTCGVRTDGAVVCWGDNNYGKSDAPGGSFASVSAGSQHSCGVRSDGAAVCLGSNSDGQSDPPSGSFTAVSAGEPPTCMWGPVGVAEGS